MQVENKTVSEIYPRLEDTLRELSSRILRYLPRGLVRRIVHYGSTANGVVTLESDIDIAVLVEENDIWRTRFSDRSQEEINKKEGAKLGIGRFQNYLHQTLPGYDERFAIYFVTPHDLGFFNFLTQFSPKGRLGEAWLNGKSLFCDPNPGWWHQGEKIEFTPTEEDYRYRAQHYQDLIGS